MNAQKSLSRKFIERRIVKTVAEASKYGLSRLTLPREKFTIMDDNTVPFPPLQEIMDTIQKLALNRYPKLTAARVRERLGEYISVHRDGILVAISPRWRSLM